ncbi:hypothetical protein FBUS_00251 [Fasciolopsis buskii]|uniref:Uncharacterized protein n=1 Tax=Fasciolopsis buskii TaxID=27845 RepID=A0A8E0VJH8_9TREM|nr:hypothetical protein FBUS_00251 [Fasciolopsis buski]
MASSDTGLICWRPVSDPPLGYRLQTVTANENSADITYSFYPFATKLGRLCFDYIVRKRQSEEHEDRIVAEWNRGFIEKCLPHGFRSHPSQTNRQLEHGEMRSSVHEIGSLSSDKRTSVTGES